MPEKLSFDKPRMLFNTPTIWASSFAATCSKAIEAIGHIRLLPATPAHRGS
jgi:hypothetical protein